MCCPRRAARAKIQEGADGIEQISNVGLVWDFMKLVFSSDGLAWRTALTMVADQMKNVYLYFTIAVTVYFADVLFADKPGAVFLVHVLGTLRGGRFEEVF